MLNAQMHVEASSEALLQRCSRLLSHSSYDMQPTQLCTPQSRRQSHRQDSHFRSSDMRADSGRYASTSSSRGVSPLYAAPPESSEQPEGPRDDDVLPDSLSEALVQAAESTHLALDGPGGRYLVEVLVPEFWAPSSGAIFAEEGDQQRFWRMTKKYAETLCGQLEGGRMKVLYPDAGTAAMLANQWPDRAFAIAGIKDRNPVQEEDECVLLAAPDPQSLNECRKIADSFDEGKHIIMFNPRLMSLDVGVGLASRRTRDQFLATFQVTYALRPVGQDASLFRQYPQQWKVFVGDPSSVGRYTLAAEMAAPPPPDVLNDIVRKASMPQGPDGEPEKTGLFGNVAQTLGSFSSFVRNLSRVG